MLRHKNKLQFTQNGFTVIELLVVFLIMVLLSGLVVISWNQQRPSRSLTIAQNELVTNIRKTQSYAVSSRNLANGSSAKFYLVKFENGANSYSIHAIDSSGNYNASPIETINLPSNVEISEMSVQSLFKTSLVCSFVIYSLPFGKAYFYTDETKPCDIESNLPNLVADLPTLAAKSDDILTVTTKYINNPVERSVSVYGISGRVEAIE